MFVLPLWNHIYIKPLWAQNIPPGTTSSIAENAFDFALLSDQQHSPFVFRFLNYHSSFLHIHDPWWQQGITCHELFIYRLSCLGTWIGLYKIHACQICKIKNAIWTWHVSAFQSPLNFFNTLVFHVFHKHEVFMKAFIVADLLSGWASPIVRLPFQIKLFHFLPLATHQSISARCQIAYLYRATDQVDSQHATYALHVTKNLLILCLIANHSRWYKEKPMVEWWIFWKERAEPPNFFFERLLEWGVGCARFSQL